MLGGKKSKKSAKIDSLIGNNTEIQGDIIFNGGLHIDGVVKGNVIAAEEGESLLTLSEDGLVEGEVRVPYVILNGSVVGDVYTSQRVELAANAKVSGNVYYTLIEMAIGAAVNGQLVHRSEVSLDPHGERQKKSEPKLKSLDEKAE